MKIEDVRGDFAHERVVRCTDDATGLRSIVAVHSTKLGPALGGTRFYPFASDADALADVLRLSQAMTYKNAAAGLDLGGGKAVIIGDPGRDRSEDLLRAYGRFVDSLGGSYITTEDVGTTVPDMDLIAAETRWVTGTSAGSGDPSDATAWGLFSAMRALARRLWGDESLEGRHIAIQGVGKVGGYLAGHLAGAGARLTVADISEEAVRRLVDAHAAAVAAPGEIHKVDCDVFSPCALSGAVSVGSAAEMACAAVCGAANNQLATPEAAAAVAQRGIVYCPDFIVNAGGVINIWHELHPDGYDRERAFAHVWGVGETLERVLARAEEDGVTPEMAAERQAEDRLRG